MIITFLNKPEKNNGITNTILAWLDILPPLKHLNQAGVFSPRQLEDNVVECHRGRDSEQKSSVGIINVDAESRKEFHFKNFKCPSGLHDN